MAWGLPFLVCIIYIYAQYVSGQATTSASAVASTITGPAPVGAYVYPPLTVTGNFPWRVASCAVVKPAKALQFDCQFVHDFHRLYKLVRYISNLDMHRRLW